jgi:hypothetical protein
MLKGATTGAHPTGAEVIAGRPSAVNCAIRKVPAATPAGVLTVTPLTAARLVAVEDAPADTVPGAAVTVIVRDAVVPGPEALDDVSVTVCVPAVNVCAGFRSVEVPPSPKFHDHDVGLPVEASMNDTASGAVPDSGETVNEETGVGAAATVTVLVAVVPVPTEFDAVNVTV